MTEHIPRRGLMVRSASVPACTSDTVHGGSIPRACMREPAPSVLIARASAIGGPERPLHASVRRCSSTRGGTGQGRQVGVPMEIGDLGRAVLDSLPVHIAVLDRDGAIIAANDAWTRFARDNGALAMLSTGVGANYRDVCRQAADAGSDDAKAVLDGMQAVLDGQIQQFTREYPCHSPDEDRWFVMSVTALPGQAGGAVVAHMDGTSRWRAQEERTRLAQRVQSLLDSTAEGIYGIDPDGRCTFVNRAAMEMLGYSAGELLGQDAHALIHSRRADGSPYPRDECPVARPVRTGMVQRTPSEVLWRKDGTPLPVEYSSAPVVVDGAITGAVVTFTDVTERQRAEAERERLLAAEQAARRRAEAAEQRMVATARALDLALLESELLNAVSTAASGEDDIGRILIVAIERLRGAVGLSGGSVALIDGDELVVRAAMGPFAAVALGQRLARGTGTGRLWQIVDTREPFLARDLAAEGYRATSPLRSYLAVPLIWRGAVYGIIEIDSTEPEVFDQSHVVLMQKIADVLSGPIQLAQRYAAEVDALGRTRDARERLRFLAEASTLLTASLDYEETLQSVARFTVPRLADWCTVNLVEPDGSFSRLAVAHVDPAKERVLDDIRRRYPTDPDSQHPLAQALREGRSTLFPDVSRAFLQGITHDAEHLRLAEQIAPLSVMLVPLFLRGRILGVLTLATAESGRHFTADDLALAEELARRAASAVENARLYRETERGLHAVEAKNAEVEELNAALERRVSERTAELEATNRELESFSYSVSHDLRAPLRSIDGFSLALLEDFSDKLDAEGQDYLQRVRSASQRMAQLIDDLLNLSRVTRSDLRREPVDLSALARAVAGEFQRAEPRRDVRVEIMDGMTADGDSRLLRVVLVNLIGNAWKFTSKRHDAWISFRAIQHNGGTAYEVRDNGVGFDPAYATKLFGAFQRLHGTADFEGSGIGLATVQRVIHRHGGRVWAEGGVDQGAAFYFTLEP